MGILSPFLRPLALGTVHPYRQTFSSLFYFIPVQDPGHEPLPVQGEMACTRCLPVPVKEVTFCLSEAAILTWGEEEGWGQGGDGWKGFLPLSQQHTVFASCQGHVWNMGSFSPVLSGRWLLFSVREVGTQAGLVPICYGLNLCVPHKPQIHMSL